MASSHYSRRVRSKLQAWRAIGAPPSVLRWIKEGIRLEWESSPPAPFQFDNYQIPEEAEQWWNDGEAERLMELGAIEEGECEDYVSPAFMVPKSTPGQWRLVIDLRHVNQFVRKFSSRLETLKTVGQVAYQTDKMIVIDIADGFYHLSVAREHRDYLTFRLFGKCYRFVGLPMGYTNSPYHFCRMMKVVSQFMRDPQLASRNCEWMRSTVTP